jgi:pilus assembly protein CpaE
MRTNVLLMTTDRSVAAAVSRALSSNGHVITAVAQDAQELLTQLNSNPSVVALVDLDPSPSQTLSRLEQLAGRFPAARFVALAGAVQPDLLQDAMQAGVRRVVAKQSVEAELQGVLNRLSPGEAAGAPRGDVITVLQAAGGCGATTIAANLAAELAATQPPQESQRTVVIDLDCCYGALTTYFGLAPLYALDHLLHYERALDAELLRSTATLVSPQLHLLASPVSTQGYRPQSPDLSRLAEVVSVASRTYRQTVIDAPRLPAEAVAALVAGSTHVLLVFQLMVKDVRLARAMLDWLDVLGIARSHVIPVANRYGRRPPISLSDAAMVLGGGANVKSLRSDFPAASEAANFGKTLAQAAPRSPFRKDLQELVAELTLTKATR